MAAEVASSVEERPKATRSRPSEEIKVHRLRAVEVSSAAEQLEEGPVPLVDSAHKLQVLPQVADCLVMPRHSHLHHHSVAHKEASDSSLKAVHQEVDSSVELHRVRVMPAHSAEVSEELAPLLQEAVVSLEVVVSVVQLSSQQIQLAAKLRALVALAQSLTHLHQPLEPNLNNSQEQALERVRGPLEEAEAQAQDCLVVQLSQTCLIMDKSPKITQAWVYHRGLFLVQIHSNSIQAVLKAQEDSFHRVRASEAASSISLSNNNQD